MLQKDSKKRDIPLQITMTRVLLPTNQITRLALLGYSFEPRPNSRALGTEMFDKSRSSGF